MEANGRIMDRVGESENKDQVEQENLKEKNGESITVPKSDDMHPRSQQYLTWLQRIPKDQGNHCRLCIMILNELVIRW